MAVSENKHKHDVLLEACCSPKLIANVVAGPRGFEPLFFGFLPRGTSGGRRLNPCWATGPLLQTCEFRFLTVYGYSLVRSSFIHQAFFFPDFSPA